LTGLELKNIGMRLFSKITEKVITAYRCRTTCMCTKQPIGVTINMLMELKSTNGHNDQLELYQDKVIIKRKGFNGKLHFGFHKVDKTIYLSQISGIKLKEPEIMMGYIQFIHPGNIERTKDSFFGGSEVKNDENIISFHNKDIDLAKRTKLEIENRIINYSQPLINSNSDGPDKILKYKQLCGNGLITKEEYETKKKEIFGL